MIVNTIKVKDLMVPLDEYATVNEDDTLYEAMITLDRNQREFDQNRYRHRAVLVMNETGKVVGKLSQLDILKALEPKYQEILKPGRFQSTGFSKGFLRSMIKDYDLFNDPLEDICRKAGGQKVKKFMYTPSEGEYVDESGSLGEAIHQLVVGHHQSLLVTQQRNIVGILRLTDVFAAVYDVMKDSCSI